MGKTRDLFKKEREISGKLERSREHFMEGWA